LLRCGHGEDVPDKRCRVSRHLHRDLRIELACQKHPKQPEHRRQVRSSLYGLNGEFFATLPHSRLGYDYEKSKKIEESCPTVKFEFDDYDGQRIIVTTKIEEREWHFGTGWFKWLSWFRKPKISRSLDLRFSDEVGPEEGSWKGGTIGHSIEMMDDELHEAAFRRYCEKEHRAKSRKFFIKFIGKEQP